MAKKNMNNKKSEPNLIIKPIGKLGGLDGIHVLLILLLIVALALLLYTSYAKQSILIITNQSTNQTFNNTQCQYGVYKNSCVTPVHNATQIKKIFENLLASYTTVNNQDSLIPFISNTSQIKEYYSPLTKTWVVTVIDKDILTNSTFLFSAIINDTNTSKIIPSIQTVLPSLKSKNLVTGNGYIDLTNKTSCITENTTPVYWFIDPYSPGSINSLSYYEQIQKSFNKSISPDLYILYTQYSQEIANEYGLHNATMMGKYLFCASKQPNFDEFASTLNSSYQNLYISTSELNSIAKNSDLNITQLSSCISTAGTAINRQAIVANYYNVTASPFVVIGCKYQTIPQMAYQAICSIKNYTC
ncbi:MAG: hypothetical protein ACP5M9_01580 [Candidatus Micrarchaeia archaeon]